MSITETKLNHLYEKIRVLDVALEYFDNKVEYSKKDLEKRKKLEHIREKVRLEILTVCQMKQNR